MTQQGDAVRCNSKVKQQRATTRCNNKAKLHGKTINNQQQKDNKNKWAYTCFWPYLYLWNVKIGDDTKLHLQQLYSATLNPRC